MLYFFQTHPVHKCGLMVLSHINTNKLINPSSLKGVATTPLTVFALVLKIAQPRGKIAPGMHSKLCLQVRMAIF